MKKFYILMTADGTPFSFQTPGVTHEDYVNSTLPEHLTEVDERNAVEDPDGISNIGTFKFVQDLYPDAVRIEFAEV